MSLTITIVLIVMALLVLGYVSHKFSLMGNLDKLSREEDPHNHEAILEIQRDINRGHAGLGGF